MKAITCLAALSLNLAVLSAPALATELSGWSANLESAIESAKRDKKHVLVEFTGSDWCPPCIAVRKNVFSKKEFVDAATRNFHLVEIDNPQKDKELAKKNIPLFKQYNIEEYPTVVLLDEEGKEYGRFYAAKYLKMEDFLKKLDEMRERKGLD